MCMVKSGGFSVLLFANFVSFAVLITALARISCGVTLENLEGHTGKKKNLAGRYS